MFLLFKFLKKYTFFKNKWRARLFNLYQALFIYKKLAAGQKFDLFVQKSLFFCSEDFR